MENILDRFRLKQEKENEEIIIDNITKGVSFRGTNLWILIFAIFIASLGLNLNATAVIIGAMLISPLMGPIMGLGLALGINDLALLRKSLSNFGYAVIVSLITSTFYFLLSPLQDAHSELLSRTYPTIYDVLVALFGGLAGILATSSKLKGNVIPGVAIATALMPPLCTAGYGLATQQWNFFFGAIYLFLINSVFIAAATLLTVRLLKIPHKHLPDAKAEARARKIIITILIVTLAPSIYLGYDIVQKDRFIKKVNRFIETECILPDDYLLNKKLDPENRIVVLTFGGKEISQEQIQDLKNKIQNYGLENATLEIKQGFSYLTDYINTKDQKDEVQGELELKEVQNILAKEQLTKQEKEHQVSKQIYNELKIQYPALTNLYLEPSAFSANDSMTSKLVFLVVVEMKGTYLRKEKIKIEEWLKLRLKADSLHLVFTN